MRERERDLLLYLKRVVIARIQREAKLAIVLEKNNVPDLPVTHVPPSILSERLGEEERRSSPVFHSQGESSSRLTGPDEVGAVCRFGKNI